MLRINCDIFTPKVDTATVYQALLGTPSRKMNFVNAEIVWHNFEGHEALVATHSVIHHPDQHKTLINLNCLKKWI